MMGRKLIVLYFLMSSVTSFLCRITAKCSSSFQELCHLLNICRRTWWAFHLQAPSILENASCDTVFSGTFISFRVFHYVLYFWSYNSWWKLCCNMVCNRIVLWCFRAVKVAVKLLTLFKSLLKSLIKVLLFSSRVVIVFLPRICIFL